MGHNGGEDRRDGGVKAASSKSSAPATPSTSSTPRLHSIVEIFEERMLFSCCCSRPTTSSGVLSDVADTRAPSASSAPAAPSAFSTPRLSELSTSSRPSISATEPRQMAPPLGIAAAAPLTPRNPLSAPLLDCVAPRPTPPRPTPPCPDNPGTVVTALSTPQAPAPPGATCPASSPDTFAPPLLALAVFLQPRACLPHPPYSTPLPPPLPCIRCVCVPARARTSSAHPAPITLANISCQNLPQRSSQLQKGTSQPPECAGVCPCVSGVWSSPASAVASDLSDGTGEFLQHRQAPAPPRGEGSHLD